MDSNHSQILIPFMTKIINNSFPKEQFCWMWQLCLGPALGESEKRIGSLRLVGYTARPCLERQKPDKDDRAEHSVRAVLQQRAER